MRILLLSLLALLAAAPSAAAATALERTVLIDIDEVGPVTVDVDGDGSVEEFTSRLLEDEVNRVPTIHYACGEQALGPRQERNAIELLSVEGDTSTPTLIAVFASSGASGRLQTTWVHRLLPSAAEGACPELQTVFRFPHRTAKTPRPPRGTRRGSASSSALVRDGKIWFKTLEGFYGRSDSGSLPSFTRTILWRPIADGSRYVRARTRLRRVPSPS